jgi:hypothetical protein
LPDCRGPVMAKIGKLAKRSWAAAKAVRVMGFGRMTATMANCISRNTMGQERVRRSLPKNAQTPL